jgi:hypothetical protein
MPISHALDTALVLMRRARSRDDELAAYGRSAPLAAREPAYEAVAYAPISERSEAERSETGLDQLPARAAREPWSAKARVEVEMLTHRRGRGQHVLLRHETDSSAPGGAPHALAVKAYLGTLAGARLDGDLFSTAGQHAE